MIDGGEAIRKLALSMARYSGVASLARPFLGGIGAILMLHRVTATPEKPDGFNSHLNIAPDFLDAVIEAMKADGYSFVSMDEAVERIRGGGKGGRFAAITADDGYRDNVTEALPVLQKHRAPITIYIAPALIDGDTHLWWEVIEDIANAGGKLSVAARGGELMLDCSTPAMRRSTILRLHELLTMKVPEEEQEAVLRKLADQCGVDADSPRRALMNWDEIRAASNHPLVTIGAHTIRHRNLRRLSAGSARDEIEGVQKILHERLGAVPRHLAYPYGYASAVGGREVGMARDAAYVSAVTTRHGLLRAEHADFLHALPRISLNGRYQSVDHIRTMLSGVTTPLANAGKLVVTV